MTDKTKLKIQIPISKNDFAGLLNNDKMSIIEDTIIKGVSEEKIDVEFVSFELDLKIRKDLITNTISNRDTYFDAQNISIVFHSLTPIDMKLINLIKMTLDALEIYPIEIDKNKPNVVFLSKVYS